MNFEKRAKALVNDMAQCGLCSYEMEEEITQAFREVRDEALEEAAKVCGQGSGELSSLAEYIWGNKFRDEIRELKSTAGGK